MYDLRLTNTQNKPQHSQFPGGHNVLAGLHDFLSESSSNVLGFVGGLQGVYDQQAVPLTDELLATYRGQGGLDLLGRRCVGVYYIYIYMVPTHQIINIHEKQQPRVPPRDPRGDGEDQGRLPRPQARRARPSRRLPNGDG